MRGGGRVMVEQACTGECTTEYLEEAAPREWRGLGVSEICEDGSRGGRW